MKKKVLLLFWFNSLLILLVSFSGIVSASDSINLVSDDDDVDVGGGSGSGSGAGAGGGVDAEDGDGVGIRSGSDSEMDEEKEDDNNNGNNYEVEANENNEAPENEENYTLLTQNASNINLENIYFQILSGERKTIPANFLKSIDPENILLLLENPSSAPIVASRFEELFSQDSIIKDFFNSSVVS